MRFMTLAFAAVTSLTACATTEELSPVAQGVDEIRVSAWVGCDQPRAGTGFGCSTITDPARIRDLVAFVDERPNGWSTPWYGAPIHPVRVEFYRGDSLVESLGVSAYSIERRIFLSRPIASDEVDQLMVLLELDRSHLRFRMDDPIPE